MHSRVLASSQGLTSAGLLDEKKSDDKNYVPKKIPYSEKNVCSNLSVRFVF